MWPVSWYWVVAASTPRVATGNAAYGEPESLDGAVLAQCFNSIL